MSVARAALPSAPLTSPDTTHFAADVRTLWLDGRDPTRIGERARTRSMTPSPKKCAPSRGRPSGYGIVAYAVGGLPLPFVGDKLRANIFGQKVLSGTILVLTGLARRAGREAARDGIPRRRMAAIAMNPMFVWQFPGDGHNDIMMAAFGTIAMLLPRPEGLAAAWCGRRPRGALGAHEVLGHDRRAGRGGGLVPEAAANHRRRSRDRRTHRVVGFFGFFKPSVATIGPLEGVTRNTPWNFIFDGFNLEGTSHDVVLAVCYSGAILVDRRGLPLPQVRRPSRTSSTRSRLTMALFLFLFAPTLRQWYLIWGFPVVMLSSRRWLRYGAVAFSLCGFFPTLALELANHHGATRPGSIPGPDSPS